MRRTLIGLTAALGMLAAGAATAGPVAGGAAGAVAGAVVAGPVGAVVGGATGVVVGSHKGKRRVCSYTRPHHRVCRWR